MISTKLLSLDEVVLLLGYKKSYIYKLTSSGILPHSKPTGKRMFFNQDIIEQWALKNQTKSLEEKKIDADTYVACN